MTKEYRARLYENSKLIFSKVLTTISNKADSSEVGKGSCLPSRSSKVRTLSQRPPTRGEVCHQVEAS